VSKGADFAIEPVVVSGCYPDLVEPAIKAL